MDHLTVDFQFAARRLEMQRNSRRAVPRERISAQDYGPRHVSHFGGSGFGNHARGSSEALAASVRHEPVQSFYRRIEYNERARLCGDLARDCADS